MLAWRPQSYSAARHRYRVSLSIKVLLELSTYDLVAHQRRCKAVLPIPSVWTRIGGGTKRGALFYRETGHNNLTESVVQKHSCYECCCSCLFGDYDAAAVLLLLRFQSETWVAACALSIITLTTNCIVAQIKSAFTEFVFSASKVQRTTLTGYPANSMTLSTS